jgi:dUTPase
MFKVFKDGKLPTRGSKYSAAVDLYAREDVVIGAGETVLVPLGVCIDEDYLLMMIEDKIQGYTREQQKNTFMSSHYLQLMLRSSLSKELIIANGVGVIDLDYKDEVMIRVHKPIREYHITWWIDRVLSMCGIETNFNNNNSANFQIKKGDRVCQVTLLEHKSHLFGIESEDERVGGFGSSGR